MRFKCTTFWFQTSIWRIFFSTKIGRTQGRKTKKWIKLNWFDSSNSIFWSAKKWQLFATSHERWDSSGKKLQYFWMCESILHHTPYLITVIELSTVLLLTFTFEIIFNIWSLQKVEMTWLMEKILSWYTLHLI